MNTQEINRLYEIMDNEPMDSPARSLVEIAKNENDSSISIKRYKNPLKMPIAKLVSETNRFKEINKNIIRISSSEASLVDGSFINMNSKIIRVTNIFVKNNYINLGNYKNIKEIINNIYNYITKYGNDISENLIIKFTELYEQYQNIFNENALTVKIQIKKTKYEKYEKYIENNVINLFSNKVYADNCYKYNNVTSNFLQDFIFNDLILDTKKIRKIIKNNKNKLCGIQYYLWYYITAVLVLISVLLSILFDLTLRVPGILAIFLIYTQNAICTTGLAYMKLNYPRRKIYENKDYSIYINTGNYILIVPKYECYLYVNNKKYIYSENLTKKIKSEMNLINTELTL